jgi:type VI secretion system protein ImpK
MTADAPRWTGMMDVTARQLEQFWTFYQRVLHLEERIRARLADWQPKPDDPSAEPPVTAEEIAGELRPTLQNWLYFAHREAGPSAMRHGTAFDAQYLDDPVYAMSCLADEIFIHDMDWEGRDEWLQNPLELQLFRTRVGGERLFQRIEHLLHQGGGAGHWQLATIYLWTLSLHFRGQYRGSDDGGRIAFLRKRLFGLIFRRPSELHAIEPPLIPEAHAHTLDQGRGGRLRSWKSWAMYWLILTGVLLLVSVVVWWATTADLRRSLDLLLGMPGMAG